MKYPNGFFKQKHCRKCSNLFQPEAPSHHYCSKECREWGYVNAYYLRNYRLTKEQVDRIAEEVGHVCQICGEEGFVMDPTRHKARLVVDHCHTTGVVRGLLCHNCNRALGLFGDSPELLKRASEYLQAKGAETIRKEYTSSEVEAPSP